MGQLSPMDPFPDDLVLTPVSRKPTRLPEATTRAVLTANPGHQTIFNEKAHGSSQPLSSVTIVVVTYNNLVYTKLCLESILANTEHPSYEIIIVDNGSSDGTIAYLNDLMERFSHVRVRLNERNLGFAPANNQGLAAASGDVLVMLNNDTMAAKGWLAGLLRHLDDPAVGLVGPVSNRTANEAQVDARYDTYGEFVQFASDYLASHHGESFDIRTPMMFCTAVRRDVYEHVGPLDERYEMGLFEDDDYAMRVREAGYRVICAADVFVHHFGQASFGKLVADGKYGALFRTNRRRFEAKWGVEWTPHASRVSPEYRQLRERVRDVVRASVPQGATVAVISRGDDALLDLDGREAWHFPRAETGGYPGHYPADGMEAIAHLDALRAAGAEFLVIPATAFWWLEYYSEFERYLQNQRRMIARDQDTCMVFRI